MPQSEEEKKAAKTTAAREVALKHLAEHKEEIDKFKSKIGEQEGDWEEEIALLERRVKTNIIKVPIGDKKKGETLAIRGSLSDFEINKIAELDNLRKTLTLKDDLELINQITYVMLGVVTANPTITSDWLAKNPTKYSTEDMLSAYLTYQEGMIARARRVAQIQQFR
jgi:hypothetical protein